MQYLLLREPQLDLVSLSGFNLVVYSNVRNFSYVPYQVRKDGKEVIVRSRLNESRPPERLRFSANATVLDGSALPMPFLAYLTCVIDVPSSQLRRGLQNHPLKLPQPIYQNSKTLNMTPRSPSQIHQALRIRIS